MERHIVKFTINNFVFWKIRFTQDRTHMLEITVGHKCLSKSLQLLKYLKQASVKRPLCSSTHVWQYYRLNQVNIQKEIK